MSKFRSDMKIHVVVELKMTLPVEERVHEDKYICLARNFQNKILNVNLVQETHSLYH